MAGISRLDARFPVGDLLMLGGRPVSGNRAPRTVLREFFGVLREFFGVFVGNRVVALISGLGLKRNAGNLF